MNYNSAPLNTEAVLKLISRSATGRKLLERFMPLFTSRKVRIENYPIAVASQLRAVLGEGQPIGACFVQDGKSGVIYLDFSSPIGVLAPFLVHEMVHCLDSKLWKIAENPGMTSLIREVQFRSELDAFEAQHLFIHEMKERFPEYQNYLKNYFPKAKILHERLSEGDISELYGEMADFRRA
jgi:hypothetical protein